VAKAVKSKQQKLAKRQDAKRADAKKAGAKKAGVKKADARRDEGKRPRGRIEKTRTQAKPVAKPSERKGISKFVHDVRVEMKKVTWPTRKDLTQSTIVVIVAVIIAGTLIAAYDFVFERIINLVIPK
jgi:preprotein translocase subunit SecE